MAIYFVFEYCYGAHGREAPAPFLEEILEQVKRIPNSAEVQYEPKPDEILTVRVYAYEADSAKKAVETYDLDLQIGDCIDFFDHEHVLTVTTKAFTETIGNLRLEKLQKLWTPEERLFTVYGQATVSVGVRVQAKSKEEALLKAFEEVTELTSFEGGQMVGVLDDENSWVNHDGEIEYTDAEEE